MAGFFSRLLRGGTKPVEPQAVKPRTLKEGLDALQRDYWRADPAALNVLLATPRDELSWRDALRLHHLLCLQRATDSHECLHPTHAQLISHLCAANSPYRPRHAFVWEGDGPPEGDHIPYSTHQGRLSNAALTHLGSLEVVRLDESLRPKSLDFIAFDELMTIAATGIEDVRGARVLLEYGREETVVLLVDSFAEIDGVDDANYLLEPALADLTLPVPLAPTQLIGSGPQRLRRISDFAAEGLAEFALHDCYQISWAIETEDPRFEQKCRGRELDPEQMRKDLERERRSRRQPTKKVRLRTL